MYSSFPILVKKAKSDDRNSLVLQNYQVCYNEEKMSQFLENIKLQYPQKCRDYGTINDINMLQDFSIIDEIECSKIDVVGKCGVPDVHRQRYKRYPAIYKLLLNSLTAETFNLAVFIEYYKKIQTNGKISLYSDTDLIACLSNKTCEEIDKITYFQTHYDKLKFYNDEELKMTKEEYKKILHKYFSLMKIKHIALGALSKNIIMLANFNREILLYDDLFDNTEIAKKFRKI